MSLSYIVLFIAFVLPGSVSIYAYRLRVPQHTKELKHFIVEAVCVSLVNFIALFYFLQRLFEPGYILGHPFVSWIIVVACFIVLPFVFSLFFVLFLRKLSDWKIISLSEHTSFDRFFGTLKKDCFLLVELNDGRLVGGYFGKSSYASAYPNQGHLYIEKLYKVDANGALLNQPVDGASIILGPEDYKHVIIYDNI